MTYIKTGLLKIIKLIFNKRKGLQHNMSTFREIACNDLNRNVFKSIGKDWMLITAGNAEAYNTMTASWGGLGCIWNKNVAFCFIRPQRYTFQFTENNEYFSLAFFDESYKKQLGFCGSETGREVNKAEKCGFTPCFDEAAPYFEQANTVIICKKMYTQTIDPNGFKDESIKDFYKEEDYHIAYIGEIVKILQK